MSEVNFSPAETLQGTFILELMPRGMYGPFFYNYHKRKSRESRRIITDIC